MGLIVVVIGGMLLHDGAIVARAVVDRYRPSRTGVTYVRLNRFQVVQHALLVVGFTVLVITGFALRFADAWWVAPWRWLGVEEATRRVIHRVAGVAMIPSR